MDKKIILVVCNGNIHRSVIAELCLNRVLKEWGLDKRFVAVSRGTQGTCGTTPPKHRNLYGYPLEWSKTKPHLEKIGVTIPENQQAMPIDSLIVKKAAIILAMDQKVFMTLPNSLIRQFPESIFKMRLFREFKGEPADVPDCEGSSDDKLYHQTIMLIDSIAKDCLEVLLKWVDIFGGLKNRTFKKGSKNMKPISRIILSGDKREKQKAREFLAREYDIKERISEREGLMSMLNNVSLSQLDRKVKHGANLTFEEAFGGMCYVLAATNIHFFEMYQNTLSFSPEKALATGTAFAQLMAAKEAFCHLTAEEVAGMTAAGLLDTVVRFDLGRVVETCGMGGDTGFKTANGIKKTINVSTLTALVLSALGLPTIKHGSYANTSAIGSTEAIELFGAKISLSSAKAVEAIWQECGFCYFDAHWCKTIHDLSHLLMIETINHVVGPMSPPLTPKTRITKLMGVNEKVHPAIVAQAYNILHQKKLQEVGGVIVICGLDQCRQEIDPNDDTTVRKYVIIDEISPFTSVIAVAYQDKFFGTFLIAPEDFGVEIDPEAIKIVNTKESIQQANSQALQGKNQQLVNYLAMNAALGLFAERFLPQPEAVTSKGLNHEYLRECFKECHQVILEGKSWKKLALYVKATGGKLTS